VEVHVDWSDRAACLSAEPETFFPVGTTGIALDDVSVAKRICAGCAVLEQCRDYALRSRQPFGVWGGLDEEQRRQIWAREAAPAMV
jgi:WhiB family redox-sensing transcriptional regulator